MPKNNKITDRVFADMAETKKHKSGYEKFLNIDKELGIEETTILTTLKKKYTDIVNDSVDNINLLAALEEIIIQIRSKEVIDSELRLSLNREYIYARSTFYRRDNQINDIRVLIGKVSRYGDDIDQLIKSPLFRIICKSKLIEAMDKEIEKNINQLNLITYEQIQQRETDSTESI